MWYASAGKLTAMESCGKVKKTGFDASGASVSTRSASNCFPTCIKGVLSQSILGGSMVFSCSLAN